MTTANGSRSKPLMRHNGYWYCNLLEGGEKRQHGLGVKGADKEPEAWAAFQRLKDGLTITEQIQGQLSTVGNVLDYYQQYLEKHHAKQASFCRDLLPRYKETFGPMAIAELSPADVEDWLNRPEWTTTTQYQYGSVIRAAFNLAVKRQRIQDTPLKGLKLPKATARIRWLTEAQEKAVLEVAKPDFRQFILACLKTGGRPLSEVASVSAADPDKLCDMEKGIWLFRKHKTDGKSARNREVVLRPDMLDLCKRLAKKYPDGPLFRTAQGKLWTREGIARRWKKIRKAVGLPDDCVFYSLRHTYATRLLLKGVSIADVAVLMGNSVAMVEKHYGHILDAKDRLMEKLALLG